MSKVSVIGAGLAGCEAAWALARRGIDVTLYEMKPVKYSPAHHYEGFAELVCSNSLKAMRLNSAAGLLKAEMKAMDSLVVRCAEQYGVTIAIEPVVKHIVYDARRAHTVLDEIGSPNLQILFDPVNLLNMENVDRREEVFAEAIELLGKDIAMIHFKDFLRKDAGGQLAATGAGQGGMEDYRTILRFAKQEKPYIFATLENTTPENAVECLNYLKKQYDEC